MKNAAPRPGHGTRLRPGHGAAKFSGFGKKVPVARPWLCRHIVEPIA
jgi:hypothetical protein